MIHQILYFAVDGIVRFSRTCSPRSAPPPPLRLPPPRRGASSLYGLSGSPSSAPPPPVHLPPRRWFRLRFTTGYHLSPRRGAGFAGPAVQMEASPHLRDAS